jgi:hypothetical protein
MGNRRIGTRRLEAAVDNLLDHQVLNGINGSPFSLRNPDRIYLEEFFAQRPVLNADLANASEATRVPANRNFEILGTNASSDDVTFSAENAGIQLQTDGADNDSVIVLPHLDTNQTAWTGTKWGTENQIQWECIIRTDASVADMGFWAGMKLTNTPVYATDDDQAYFIYDSTDDSGALTTNANLHFVYSIDDTDYISDLGIAVAAATTYRLAITIDSDRKVSAWVNGVQYSLTDATTAGGVDTGKGVVKSLALDDDHDLIPYVGVIARTGAAKTLHLASQKMSRIIFE